MTDPEKERTVGLIVRIRDLGVPLPVQEPFLTTSTISIILLEEPGDQCHPIGAIFHGDLQKVEGHNGTGQPSCPGVPLSHTEIHSGVCDASQDHCYLRAERLHFRGEVPRVCMVSGEYETGRPHSEPPVSGPPDFLLPVQGVPTASWLHSLHVPWPNSSFALTCTTCLIPRHASRMSSHVVVT